MRCMMVLCAGLLPAAPVRAGEPQGWKTAATLKCGEQGVSAFALSPDGKRVACAGFNGGVRVLEVAGGKTLARVKTAPNRPVFAVAFSADGKTVTSVSQDGG